MHRHSLPRIAALPIALTCSLAVAAGPAYAGSHSHSDPTGDVVRALPDGTVAEAPDETAADLTRATVKHTANFIKLGLKVRDIPVGAGSEGMDFMPMWTLRVEGRAKPLTLAVLRMDRWVGVLMTGKAAKHVPCGRDDVRGVKVKVSPSKDTIHITVPRSCLGDPTWVKAGAALVRLPADEQAEEAFIDYSHRAGASESAVASFSPRLSPKVRRG